MLLNILYANTLKLNALNKSRVQYTYYFNMNIIIYFLKVKTIEGTFDYIDIYPFLNNNNNVIQIISDQEFSLKSCITLY